MRRGALGVAAMTLTVLAACGGSDGAPSFDAGAPDSSGGHEVVPDASVIPDAARDAIPDAAKQPWNRMQSHSNDVLASMRVVAVYFGEAGGPGAASFDAFIQWLLGSDYWKVMAQYGVGPGSLVGSVRIAASDVFAPGSEPAATISAEALQARLTDLVNGSGVDDAGADVLDASDAGPGAKIPQGDAYLFFLPDGVNVTSLNPDGTTAVTCRDIGGYHDVQNVFPYAVIPPCAFGRSALAISHELAEMATDPTMQGWYSDAEQFPDGGEIGDLCNQPVTVDGWSVTQLWSNADGDCEPPL